ncbi:MAG: hypothetical protein GY951_10240, partial [Psychromonas sp.]|nr:hypothetical protein [Psychromonas sp.]
MRVYTDVCVKMSLAFSLLFFSVFSLADNNFDIRTTSSIAVSQKNHQYILHINNCANVVNVSVAKNTFIDSSSLRNTGSSCEYAFELSNEDKLNPVANISFKDGTSIQYSEQFDYENNQPEITINSVSIVNHNQLQHAKVELSVTEDTDISNISLSLVGVRASDLRASGGVIDKAKERSFVNTYSPLIVFPDYENQSQYSVYIPLQTELSQAEIESNGVLLINASTVDASGNTHSISTIQFTGKDVNEKALAFTAKPKNIVFTDLLQNVIITPSVEYQFRGYVEMVGAGRGVTYVSSEPSKVSVSSAGLVTPLSEDATGVIISVSYPGFEAIEIPVKFDLNRALVSLKTINLSLPSLNALTKVPDIIGVFDNGSEVEITPSTPYVITIPDLAKPFLHATENGFMATSIILESSPLQVEVSLKQFPGIKGVINVTASDSIPEVQLDAPSDIAVKQSLVLQAEAKDDVGIEWVEVWLSGNLVAKLDNHPYTLNLPISQEMDGLELNFEVIAVDSSGQKSLPVYHNVKVRKKSELSIPEYSLEFPNDSATVVEQSLISFKVSSNLGSVANPLFSSGISRVEYFMDGVQVGQTTYPLFEQKQSSSSEEKELFEVWKFDAKSPSISTKSTTISVHAQIYSNNGAVHTSASKLVKIVQNSKPLVRIVSPIVGSSASAGQNISVKLEASDDTLAAGSTISFFVNEKEFYSQTIQDESNYSENGYYNYQVNNISFSLPIKEEWVGSSVSLVAKLQDAHQKISQTEPLLITIREDQKPTIAINYPAEGTQLVSGLATEVRVNASDDIGISKVDFYVNDRLIGSDFTPPYSMVYQTPQINGDAPVSFHAVATDTMGQIAKSALVNATLSEDFTAPVINLASPEISETDAGDDLAMVVESSSFALKVTGYDNVGVTNITLQGVKHTPGIGYIVTNDLTDIVEESDFKVQAIPGALNAFSAIKLISAPAFSHSEGVKYDRYPIRVIASDKAGNSSTLNVVIAVSVDEEPVVVEVSSNKKRYFGNDIAKFDLLVRDDKEIKRLEMKLLDSQQKVLLQEQLSSESSLVISKEVSTQFAIDLSKLTLLNTEQKLQFLVKAIDSQEQASGWYVIDLQVIADLQSPITAILSPQQTQVLYPGEMVRFDWKSVDQSGVKVVRATIG